MNTWLALTKKEFKLSLPAFIIAAVLFVGFMVGGYFIGRNFGYADEVLLGVSLFASSLHTLLLAFYLFYSLNTERKRLHLWLHNPMSISGLLSAKIFTNFVYMIITFAASITLNVIFFQRVTDLFNQQTLFNLTGTLLIMFLFSSLFVAAVFLFFWSIFMTLSQKMNDFLSFVITFLLFVFTSWALGKVTDLSFYQTLTQWGEIKIQDMFVGFELNVDFDSQSASGDTFLESTFIYIGDIIVEIIGIIALFFATCWIIERKVEV
ncbi:hypothetical protein [Ornithinibacillus halotolerans]|uniref:Uncharacterized protein n=1 Tax=Ornithinibacillus halotolerans TaxID=1274357 RepID=A0A916S1L2_9BACI|nr:hypothetical protein [Ornithinibacillus halotolerans]GGA80358.1 hypothetical protein GCM10008025_24700 [Ornithinibacillus halotolerans]